jgi:hypothetical protein
MRKNLQGVERNSQEGFRGGKSTQKQFLISLVAASLFTAAPMQAQTLPLVVQDSQHEFYGRWRVILTQTATPPKRQIATQQIKA